ncbi:MAG: DUF6291 domain-containing protein [Elusimicrobiota bacterium]|jgi:hypothetical protein|nr:DUF6291 domain-containing protein [Elusimicrobiota bacterium]
MTQGKKRQHYYFTFGETLETQLKKMPDKKRLEFCDAIIAYGLHRIPPNFEGLDDIIWEGMKALIDNSSSYLCRRETAKDYLEKNENNGNNERFESKKRIKKSKKKHKKK